MKRTMNEGGLNNMYLYNTLTRRREEFKPVNPPFVTFYHCGPTVYWTQHIGNLRGMTMADLIRRSLIYLGYKVKFVRNYTDVGHLISDADEGEDKMEKGAKREGLTPQQIADKYIKIFENDCRLINIMPPNETPRASEYIQPIVKMIKILLAKKHAYITPLAIYFDVSTFPNYNRLNRQRLDLNIKGKGFGKVEDHNKKHFADFALWFFKAGAHKNALQTWDSPWRVGFPGWHIECSAMTKELLGETIDIHMGGVEHISVHHTNEIAQSESANGVLFVRYWLHNEHLTVEGKKMAKSEGTGFVLSEVLNKGYHPMALRYFYLTAHYRTRQDFSYPALESAQASLNKLKALVLSLKSPNSPTSPTPPISPISQKIEQFRHRFQSAIANDLNTAEAVAVTWKMLKSNIPSVDKLDLLFEFDQVFGLKLKETEEEKIPEEIIKLAEERQKARQEKDFEKADELRKQIEKKRCQLEDTPEGYRIKKMFPIL